MMSKWGFTFSFLVVFSVSILIESSVAVIETDNDTILHIPQGSLKGIIEISRRGRNYLAFMGIPFGKVLTRFQDSIAADKWSGVKDATKYGSICLQQNQGIHGEEDCLFLNVFVPKTFTNKTEEKLAVMVFIYGGAFTTGSSNLYGPEYFMDHDVILVTINYRLGPFGFLNAKSTEAPGNQGLKDQVLALKWVQDNIELFGGDKDKVVIFGESAGAFSVSLLTISPMAKGLFNGAIAQSGCANCGHLYNKNEPSIKEAKKLAHELNCRTKNSTEMIICLQNANKTDIFMALKSSEYAIPFDIIDVPQFGVTFDTNSGENNVFLPLKPSQYLSHGNFNRVPLITGVVTDESAYLYTALITYIANNTRTMNEEWGKVVPQLLVFDKTEKDPCKISSQVKKLYFGEKSVSLETKSDLGNLFSDRYFLQCARQTVSHYSKFAPTYLYNFTYLGDHSISSLLRLPFAKGDPPVHADELQYLFNTPLFPKIDPTSPHFEFSENLLKLWTSFAKHGQPTAVWKGVESWEPLNPNNEVPDWFTIDETLSVRKEDPDFTKRMNFWKNIE